MFINEQLCFYSPDYFDVAAIQDYICALSPFSFRDPDGKRIAIFSSKESLDAKIQARKTLKSKSGRGMTYGYCECAIISVTEESVNAGGGAYYGIDECSQESGFRPDYNCPSTAYINDRTFCRWLIQNYNISSCRNEYGTDYQHLFPFI